MVDLALPLLEEALKLHKAEFGPEHADTLTTMNNLAGAYLAAGKQDLAQSLFEETLKIRKVRLGSDHPDTLRSIKNLEVVRHLATANQRYQAKLAELGPKHIDTLLARRDLAQAHMGVKNLDAAESILAEVLQGMTDRPPKDPIVVFTTGILRHCLTVRQRTVPDTWTTFNTMSLLGGSLLGQKKDPEAEPLLFKGYEGMKQREKSIPQQGSTRILEALDRLIELYTVANKPDEMKKWQAERAKYPAEKAPPPRETK
jgi:hypothetical protein